MREIKFRMWTGQRYIYDQNIVFDCMRQQYSGLYDHVKLHESDFEQFTGLHDKNGKEIYEGDICRVDCGTYIEIDVIKYEGSGFKFHIENMPPKNDVEVIGNIHENPEIIKWPIAV